jgi:hypothetical protein
VSAHTRCDECGVEASEQRLIVKQRSYPGEKEYCSWACLFAVAAWERPVEAANKAAWYAKVNSTREVFPAQSPVDDVSASGGRAKPHSDPCNQTQLDPIGARWFCQEGEGHSGPHRASDGLTEMMWPATSSNGWV